MKELKKCNICGREYEPYNTAPSEVDHNAILFMNIAMPGLAYRGNGEIECCPNCMRSIKEYLDILAENGKGEK